jgi:hypothetical protein
MMREKEFWEKRFKRRRRRWVGRGRESLYMGGAVRELIVL